MGNQNSVINRNQKLLDTNKYSENTEYEHISKKF